MFCKKCGSELPDGANFCAACGERQTQIQTTTETAMVNSEIGSPEMNIQPPSEMPPEPIKKPKKKGVFLKILAIIVLVVVLISGVTVLGYNTFLPAKSTLLVAEYASVLENYNIFDKNMARYEEKSVKPLYEGSLSKESELSFSLETALLEQLGLQTETIDLVAAALKNTSINYGYAMDVRSKKVTFNLGVKYQMNPVLTANLFLDDTKFGLGVPELTKKTIVGDLKNLDKLTEVFSDIPADLIDTYKSIDPWISARLYDEVKIDRKGIKTLMMDYSQEIIKSIDSGDMSIKRGKSTDVLGKNMKCQEITIKLDQNAQKKILSNVLKRLENDKNFYDLTAGNINKVMDILGESEYYQQMFDELDIEDQLSRSNFKDQIANLRDSLDESDFPEEIIAKVFIKGLDVVKYAFELNGDMPEENIVLTIEGITNDLSYEQKYTLTGNFDDGPGELSLTVKNDYDKASDTTDFTLKLDANMEMIESGNAQLLLESKEEPAGKNKVAHTVNASWRFAADLSGLNSYGVQQGEFTFTLDGTKTRNAKGLVTNSDYTGDLSLSIPEQLPQPVSIAFAVNTDTEYGKKVSIPKPTDVLDVAEATQDDYDELVNEIYGKLGALSMFLGGY